MPQRSKDEHRDPRHHLTVDRAVATAVEPALRALGLELFDAELSGSGRARTLRVFVDRPVEDPVAGAADRPAPDSSVDLEAITKATEAVSAVLDTDRAAAAALPGPYTLEVSSPGLERPLRTPEHFRSALGEQVSVKRDGTARERGTITTVDDDGIEMERPDGTTLRVPYDEITQARTVFEWGATAERGPARGKARR